MLRGCSHNCNGLTTVAAADRACAEWRRSGYHYILLQEHHLTLLTSVRVRRRLHQQGWTAYLAFSPRGASGRPRAGTGILIRSDLLSNSSLTIVGGEAAIQRAADGRYIAMPVRWSGHNLHMCSIYMPNNSTQQRQFIAAQLAPLAAAAAAGSGCGVGILTLPLNLILTALAMWPGYPTLMWAPRNAGGMRCRTWWMSTVFATLAAVSLLMFTPTPRRASTASTVFPCPAAPRRCVLCAGPHPQRPSPRLPLSGGPPAQGGPGLRRIRLAFFSSPAPPPAAPTAWLRASSRGTC